MWSWAGQAKGKKGRGAQGWGEAVGDIVGGREPQAGSGAHEGAEGPGEGVGGGESLTGRAAGVPPAPELYRKAWRGGIDRHP